MSCERSGRLRSQRSSSQARTQLYPERSCPTAHFLPLTAMPLSLPQITDLQQGSALKETRQPAYKPACDPTYSLAPKGVGEGEPVWCILLELQNLCTSLVPGESWGQRAVIWRWAGGAMSAVSWSYEGVVTMSGLRKSVARGENVGWVSRKDSNTMDRVVVGVTSIYFPWCSPESRSPWTLRRTFFFFSPQLTMVYLKKHQRASFSWGSLVAQMVKNLPAMWETWVLSLGWEDPLEKGKATHSSILPWRIPWAEKPGGLQSMRLQRVRQDWVTNTFTVSLFFFSQANVSS